MLVMTIVLSVLLLIMNIYLLAYYCHPEDNGFGSSLICKIVVVLGMTLSWAQVLMLPLDVSNTRGFGGGIRMDIFWIVIYISTAVTILVIIPALTFYYETDPDWNCWEKLKYSFCCLLVTIIVVVAILVVTYAFLSTAEIPIITIDCAITNVQLSQAKTLNISTCTRNETTLNIDVSFPIFVIGLMSFISWFLFVIFGGIGLPALPLDFIYDFCTRPKKMTTSELNKIKDKVAIRAKNFEALGLECLEMEKNDIMKKGCINTFLN
jgi:LMBR1 domain-containing protein 1